MTLTGKNLVVAATQAARLNYDELAKAAGVSRRTVQRWVSEGSLPLPSQWHGIAAIVHPHDAGLAERIAEAGGSSLVALGLAKPAPSAGPPAKPAAPPPAPALTLDHVDTLVCAAAEAADMKPADARKVVAAVFARAARLGYETAQIARVFGKETGKGKHASEAK